MHVNFWGYDLLLATIINTWFGKAGSI